jgi:lactate racemase
MKVDFGYPGIPPLEVRDSNLIGVYEPNPYRCEMDEEAVIQKGLANPIGTRPLKELVKPGHRILILVDDYTRTTPAWKIVPLVLGELRSVGAKNQNISILIAQGTHRKMSLKDKERKLGKSVLKQITVYDHEWNNEKALKYIGDTDSGIPVWVNKLVEEFDFIMGIGHIVPHSEAGFSGGAKIIQPGICGRLTTEATHWMSASYHVSDLMGKAEGPVRQEIEKIAERVGLRFIINAVEDHQGKIVGLFCGDPVLAFREGCKVSSQIYGVRIPTRSDIVVIDSYPCDTDFWVASKGVFAASLAVREGGVILLVTPCPEGIAPEHPEIVDYCFMCFPDVARLVNQGHLANDRIGAAFLSLVGNITTGKAKCILVSPGITPEVAEKLGLVVAGTPQEGLSKAYELLGENAKVMVFRHGSEIMPIVESET